MEKVKLKNIELESIKIKIGISSCLLGNKVRFDGGHKKSDYLVDKMSPHVEFVTFCPEMEIGLGVPREAIRLIGNPKNPDLVSTKDPNKNYTDKMKKYAESIDEQITNLSGFIFKTKSPSCGPRSVNVYQGHGKIPQKGKGIFADSLIKNYPYLPYEDEGRLNDAVLRENFITKVYTFSRFQDVIKNNLEIKNIIKFHERHKLIYMAHSIEYYKSMGSLVGNIKKYKLENFVEIYLKEMMDCLNLRPTKKKHANVLYHILGHFKKSIDSNDKEQCIKLIEDYRNNLKPLITPITLLNYFLVKHEDNYLNEQYYLNPYPDELMLRNHI